MMGEKGDTASTREARKKQVEEAGVTVEQVEVDTGEGSLPPKRQRKNYEEDFEE